MTRSTQTKRRYTCAICGRRRPSDDMIYSRFTGNHYCCVGGRMCRKSGRLV